MRRANIFNSLFLLTAALTMALLAPSKALAHCDGMDGPVVKAAQRALATGNVNLVLIWAPKKDEAEIINVFQKTLAVRKLSAEARELADLYFFETVVRIHRAGEGEPYTGLKPAGRDLGPAIPATDRALETGSVEPLLKLITTTAQNGVREHFNRAADKKKFSENDTVAGREYVEAYVKFIHYVERLYEVSQGSAEAHSHVSEVDKTPKH
jgi:hypothetical protein